MSDEFPAAQTSVPAMGTGRPGRCEDANVTDGALALARAGDQDAFRALTDPLPS